VDPTGEFALIRHLLDRLGPPGKVVVLGPGDDAAVLETGPTTVATADMLVEGVHFEIGLSTPADVGFKALAASLSDIAAMGAVPRYALVSIGAPPSSATKTLEALYEGIAECAAAYEVSIVGGDTVRSDVLIVSIAVTGEPSEAGIVTRAGARAGDVLCVTGTLGAAAAGLELLRAAGGDPAAGDLLGRFPSLAVAHARPAPRVAEGAAAARTGATAMIDLSDGLAADARHLCDASGVGVELEERLLPLAHGVTQVAAWAGSEAFELALGGGDDYELAIAVPPSRLDAVKVAVAPTPLVRVGEFLPDGRILVCVDGTRRRLDGLGWDHFAEER
jgi:thiamine-monophosphate kinase